MTQPPRDRAELLLQRASALLFECRAVSQRLAQAPDDESRTAEAERMAYSVLVAALEEGLVNTLEHAMGSSSSSRRRRVCWARNGSASRTRSCAVVAEAAARTE